ncbi:MAG: hypothetical protein HY594_02130 [Candidatus Omnitrophica bacterium]|nr:hypothetical protein [Candidatus Omnitrophota bacterium]
MKNPAQRLRAANQTLLRLPAAQARALRKQIRPVSMRHQMVMYEEDGSPRVIGVQLRPWLVSGEQIRFFHRACMVLKGALAKVLPLYEANPRVRQVVPLEPEEDAWIWHVVGGAHQTPQTVFDRLDCTATFGPASWQDDFWFVEPNSVGIGGIHYIPATYRTVRDLVARWLQDADPQLRLRPMPDIRDLLLGALRGHARAIGRRRLNVGFLEDQSEKSGTAEFGHVAEYFKSKGVHSLAADPRHLRLKNGEIYAKNTPIDVFYRDTEITEFLEMEREGVSLEVVREAFRRNQVVSSIAGEFDHKSAWELFTNPIFSRYFTAQERALFAKHVLWTRLIWERSTTDPSGRTVDLAAYVRKNKNTLTLKPNREYGGIGVAFGNVVTQREWERALEKALQKPGTSVIQRRARVHSEPFPVIDAKGRVTLENLYAVTGFAATSAGLAILGRCSASDVVNVSRGGGLIAVMRRS